MIDFLLFNCFRSLPVLVIGEAFLLQPWQTLCQIDLKEALYLCFAAIEMGTGAIRT
jgi:hypothetical protein